MNQFQGYLYITRSFIAHDNEDGLDADLQTGQDFPSGLRFIHAVKHDYPPIEISSIACGKFRSYLTENVGAFGHKALLIVLDLSFHWKKKPSNLAKLAFTEYATIVLVVTGIVIVLVGEVAQITVLGNAPANGDM